MERALGRPGFSLHPESPCRAAGLAWAAFHAGSGRSAGAGRLAAAAVELFMNAAYLLDGLADVAPTEAGSPARGEDLAVATALLMCAGATAARACDVAGAPSALTGLYESALQACAGQLLDALYEGSSGVTTDDALRMTSLKSGSIGRLAAGFGVRMATDDAALVSDVEDFGYNAFTFGQLIDDLRDASAPGPESDLGRNKKTVPLVYFRNSETDLDAAPADPCNGRIDRDFVLRERYAGSGADLYGAVVAEALLNRAKGAIERLRRRDCPVECLERFVATLEATTADALGHRFRARP